MKRISLSVIAVAIIAAAGVNARMNTSKKYVSSLTVANIEALAVNGEDLETENGSGCDTRGRVIGSIYLLECITGSKTSCLYGSLNTYITTQQCQN